MSGPAGSPWIFGFPDARRPGRVREYLITPLHPLLSHALIASRAHRTRTTTRYQEPSRDHRSTSPDIPLDLSDEHRPAALEGARRHRDRPADGRPRRLDREHRAALGAARPRHQRRRPAVGHHRLHPRLRRPAAARRPDRRLRRPQAHLHHRPARLRRRPRPSAASRPTRRCCSPPVPCRAPSPRCSRPAALALHHGDLHRGKERARRSASTARSPAAARPSA